MHPPRARRRAKPKLVSAALAPLDRFSARVEAILRRKGQVVLYGPPGTGKTYRALAVANELAARRAFQKSFADLTQPERTIVADGDGLVRVCTLHPWLGLRGLHRGTSACDYQRPDGFRAARWRLQAPLPRCRRAVEQAFFPCSWMRSIGVTCHASLAN